MTRANEIHERLSQFITGTLGLKAVDLFRSEWTQMDLPHPYRMGWLPHQLCEIECEDGEQVVAVMFCADLIDGTTQRLGEQSFEAYMGALECFLLAHASNDDDRPPEEVNRGVEDLMMAESPNLLPLLSRLEFWALSNGMLI